MYLFSTQRAVRTSCVAAALLSAVALTPQQVTAARIDLVLQVDEDASSAALTPGQEFDVQVVARIAVPILGFGFELDFDDSELELLRSSVGSGFHRAALPADDAVFNALAFPDPIRGLEVVLASATFKSITGGESELSLSFDSPPSGGFAEVQVNNFAFVVPPTVLAGHVDTGTDVPEPGALALLALGGCWLLRRRR